jgi:hypothetical protein
MSAAAAAGGRIYTTLTCKAGADSPAGTNLLGTRPEQLVTCAGRALLSKRDIVAIGTSAGEFEAPLFLAKGFQKNFSLRF